MAGMSFTIGGVTFNDLAGAANLRNSLGCYQQAADFDIKRFHSPGANGNYVVRNGRNGRKIIAEMLYYGAIADVYAAWVSDGTAWENAAITVVTSTGSSFARCTLDNGGFRVTKKPIGVLGNGCLFYAVATFTNDE